MPTLTLTPTEITLPSNCKEVSSLLRMRKEDCDNVDSQGKRLRRRAVRYWYFGISLLDEGQKQSYRAQRYHRDHDSQRLVLDCARWPAFPRVGNPDVVAGKDQWELNRTGIVL